MVTIVKGNQKIVCTKGTFEEQYKQLGYRLASEDKKEATKEVASSFEEKEELSTKIDDNEEEKEELSTKYGLKSKKSTTSKKEDK